MRSRLAGGARCESTTGGLTGLTELMAFTGSLCRRRCALSDGTVGVAGCANRLLRAWCVADSGVGRVDRLSGFAVNRTPAGRSY